MLLCQRNSYLDQLKMATEAILSSALVSVVLVRAGDLLCALPLATVIETLRCPPVRVIAGAPACVSGVALIRGATVAVVDLRILLESGSPGVQQARLVMLRVGRRMVALAVDAVIGVREFDRAVLAEVPPMLRRAHFEILTAVGALDRELLLVLDGSRIITEEELDRLKDLR